MKCYVFGEHVFYIPLAVSNDIVKNVQQMKVFAIRQNLKTSIAMVL